MIVPGIVDSQPKLVFRYEEAEGFVLPQNVIQYTPEEGSFVLPQNVIQYTEETSGFDLTTP